MTMRTLVLIRHATAESSSGGADRERALSPVGMDQAERLGHLLVGRVRRADRGLSSDARRARQTLRQIARTIDVAAADALDELYLCGPGDILKLVHDLTPNARTVLLVAHEPAVSATASMLAGDSRERELVARGVPTATALILRHDAPWDGFTTRTCSLEVVRAPRRREATARR